ncbi:MAG TPA: hypothetical protein VMF66_10690 [Candidatus Acidoferrum sp.]|nr:hypothetical protein [Candidatus Acidoferrum sp.]
MPTKDSFITTPQSDKGRESSETRKRDQRSHKRVPIGIALRKHGIDEYTIAETCAYTLDALKGIVPVKDSDKKLLIEFVKECTKLLAGDTTAAPSAPLRVRLIHSVARPEREQPRIKTAAALPAADRGSVGSIGDDASQKSAGDLTDAEEEAASQQADNGLLN